MRTALKLAIVLFALAAMSWCSLFVYWHLKISRAIQELQNGVPSSRTALREAGCRALPYLIATARPTQPLTLLVAANDMLQGHLAERAALFPAEHFAIAPDLVLLTAVRIEALDTVDVRATKCRELQEWWRANGSKYHQDWRIWSRRCR